MDEETTDKKCVVCGRDGMLALFGVGLGVLFILMGLDTLRRMRKEQEPNLEHYLEGGTVND